MRIPNHVIGLALVAAFLSFLLSGCAGADPSQSGVGNGVTPIYGDTLAEYDGRSATPGSVSNQPDLANLNEPGGRDGSGDTGGLSGGDPEFSLGDFPLTVINCGFTTTFLAPPQRVVAIKSPPVELMLALGVGDRLVAVAGLDGPVPNWLDATAAKNSVVTSPMATGVPGTEAVLALNPDLVFAGWESNLTPAGAGSRELFAEIGISTYVSPAACRSDRNADALTFEDIWAEIAQAGAIFSVPTAAHRLILSQQEQLNSRTPDQRELTALWWSSAKDIPYVGAGLGAPQLIMSAVGVENIAQGVADTWTSLSWEQIIAADPDVIILVDAEWNTAASKREYLENNPATAQLTAVREGRYLTVPFPASEAGVRTVSAVLDLADQLDDVQW